MLLQESLEPLAPLMKPSLNQKELLCITDIGSILPECCQCNTLLGAA
ncbi:hypothetical protein [Armatimonas sp.]